MSQHTPRYSVEPFGCDCLGNITGYRIYDRERRTDIVLADYIGNIYKQGSFNDALVCAEEDCQILNSGGWVGVKT